MKKAIHLLKAQREKGMAEPLAQIMAEWLDRKGGFRDVDFLVPVPLHPKKERTRGFNQAHLIAIALSAKIRVPVEARILRKVRSTPSQSSLAAENRASNLQGVFNVTDSSAVKWRRIMVIDDTMATGGTFMEVSLALKAAGASEIRCLCAARELIRRP
jgi:ComF family protein